MITYSFDWGGTIDFDRDAFAGLMRALIRDGHRVIMTTGVKTDGQGTPHPKEVAVRHDFLEKNGFLDDVEVFYCRQDFRKNTDLPTKLEVVKREGADMHFDNHPGILKLMHEDDECKTTPVGTNLRMWEKW